MNLWYGNENSLMEYNEVRDKILSFQGDIKETSSELLRVIDDVGVISITGPLTNRSSSWNSLLGITSYEDIRGALIEANETAGSILLNIDSGGGAVSGLSDIGNLIQDIGKEKEVVAYTSGMMASAAYWLGSSANKVYASDGAITGSVGVIATHMEYSEQLKEDGVGVTVFRAGKYKALVSQVEKLTDEAKAQYQKVLDSAYNGFLEHVAARRGMDKELAHVKIADGREFFGAEAVAAGAIDGITTFDKLFAEMRKKSLDKKSSLHNNRFTNQMEGRMNKETVVDAKAVDAVDAVDEAKAEQKDGTLVSYLQGQIKDKDTSILAMSVDAATLKQRLADMEASHNGLLAIAAKSIASMSIAMGGSGVDMSSSNAVSILAEHDRLSKQFEAKFPVGGVAAVSSEAAAEAPKYVVTSLTQAQINALKG